MKKLYESENRVAIQLLKSKLEECGIATFVKNENPPLAGEIPPIMAPPEVWVIHDEDYLQAEQLLNQEMTMEGSDIPWWCHNCNAENPGVFNICWNCNENKEKSI